MCGIAGIASPRGAVDRERLRRMSETLVHRGPDSEGMHLDGPAGIAARRLSIIDLAHGDQPIANEDGSVVVVQNGELYNYRELAHELRRAGHRFATECDTEVHVHGFEEWGLGLFERLRGMFAVAIWDARAQRLVLARDRFGIKPLYYRHVDGELSFASELDALPQGEIDLDALDAFLTFNSIPGPLSIFKEIRKLLPGHVLTWQGGAVALERYARPGPLEPRHDDDEAELVEECRARLRDSVRAHLIADVPVGVLLSGGVDSGALAALAAEETGDPLRTFSIGFEESSFDELEGARLVAEQLVAALARERDLDVLRGELRDQVRRQRRRVGERLVERVGERRQEQRGVRAQDQLAVVGPVALRDQPGGAELVERRLLEADRERAQGITRLFGG